MTYDRDEINRRNRESYARHKEKRRDDKTIYNKLNAKKIAANTTRNRKENPEKVKESQRRSDEKHPETKITFNHNYYLVHKVQMNSDNKLYRQEHKVELNISKQKWNKENPEKRAKYTHNYQEKNPEATLQRQIKYLTKIGEVYNFDYHQTKLALFTWARAVKKRDGYKCVNCGSESHLETHHIKHKKDFPLLAFDIDNGITLCDQCHYKSHGKLSGLPRK